MYKLFVLSLVLACSVTARQVHFYACGSDRIGFHSGESTLQLRDSWISAGFHVTLSTPPCPYWPQNGHYAGSTWEGGCWGQYIIVGGLLYYGQGGNDGTLCPDNGGAVQPCPACAGGNKYYVHTQQTIASSNPANQDWIWNGALKDNPNINSCRLVFDESGNIVSFYVDMNRDKIPFGGFEDTQANRDLGITPNGSWEINQSTGPQWKWSAGVIPPLNPSDLSNLNASMQSLLTSSQSSGSTLTDIKAGIALLNENQKDYTASFLGLETALSGLGVMQDIDVTLDNGEVVAELQGIKAVIDGLNTQPSFVGQNQSLVASHDSLMEALNPVTVKQKVSDSVALASRFKDTVNTVFGSWRMLPREKPNWVFAFDVPLPDGAWSFVWRSVDKIPDGWWLYVDLLRNAEVVGLCIWLFMACSRLLHRTFGGGQ